MDYLKRDSKGNEHSTYAGVQAADDDYRRERKALRDGMTPEAKQKEADAKLVAFLAVGVLVCMIALSYYVERWLHANGFRGTLAGIGTFCPALVILAGQIYGIVKLGSAFGYVSSFLMIGIGLAVAFF